MFQKFPQASSISSVPPEVTTSHIFMLITFISLVLSPNQALLNSIVFIEKNEIILHTFCVKFVLINVMFMRFIHIVTGVHLFSLRFLLYEIPQVI